MSVQLSPESADWLADWLNQPFHVTEQDEAIFALRRQVVEQLDRDLVTERDRRFDAETANWRLSAALARSQEENRQLRAQLTARKSFLQHLREILHG